MDTPKKIALLGSGSWATAIAKILHLKIDSVNWYIREDEIIENLYLHHRNPLYLSDVRFNIDILNISNDVNESVKDADIVIFCVPSKFIIPLCESITEDLSKKQLVTAIKGIVPNRNILISDYLAERFNVSHNQLACISGPCHAEEVALDRLSYLTIGSPNQDLANEVAKALSVYFIKTTTSKDIAGIEYAAVIKNIMALATGISHGLRFGDNFIAVLISNAVKEMKAFLEAASPTLGDVNDSVYLGDLLVTAYSQFSRNRTFGQMIGKGYTVKTAELEMNMIAEGYYAAGCIHEIHKNYKDIDMPITEAVYHILYERISPTMEFKLLSERFS